MTIETLLEDHEKMSARFNTLLMSTEPGTWMEEKGAMWELFKPFYYITMVIWNILVHIARLLFPVPGIIFTIVFNLVKVNRPLRLPLSCKRELKKLGCESFQQYQ